MTNPRVTIAFNVRVAVDIPVEYDVQIFPLDIPGEIAATETTILEEFKIFLARNGYGNQAVIIASE